MDPRPRSIACSTARSPPSNSITSSARNRHKADLPGVCSRQPSCEKWHTLCDITGKGDTARNLEFHLMSATIDATQIKPHMPVICSDGGQFATVDHTDSGDTIKLTKDESGQHHWIPMSWVTRVDEHVHVDRPGKQAMQEWSTSNPSA